MTFQPDRAQGERWALVLAAGEGSRLRALTMTQSGLAVPKQYCSLYGDCSLLDETIARARRIVPSERVCVIVAAHHKRWWDRPLAAVERDNVIVQPRSRGTANGILLPLLHILERDPNARLAILPSDHHVQDEATLQRSLQAGLSAMEHDPLGIALLGIDPECADVELGYIVPGAPCGPGIYQTSRFVEKPPLAVAQALIREGALWNAFIVVARARALLELIRRHCPGAVSHLQRVLHQSPRSAGLSAAYEHLAELDFSRHVAQPAADSIRVLRVPWCGWSDLGTPGRVAEVLSRATMRRVMPSGLPTGVRHLSLAEQFARVAHVSAGA